ncbi:uncharacterized protein BXZ73DRAFT_88724 [Epithele typhae]|uniref:uncharacterized protein n=1 Tax=Epithele typhae TaxID=378194 RepID=UPI0020081F6C|nr:uncharacterized protein BXZ73DRAFT_88724 [Epithele typhae]KAH9940497.1 hypothetical protein BXZ73DRAFT_88724 [Epithele typhae]
MDASPPTSIPRLRLPRHTLLYQDQALTPIAGPSTQNSDFLRAEDDDEDAESTPRMGAASIPDKSSPKNTMSSIPSSDNPTARLRALLARVPNSPVNGAPVASASRHMSFPSTSDIDSDFEPPPSTNASSVVRESLKELFSHALREAGNTPRKTSRPRRNSIDGSEVESNTPKFEERARHKASRQVLSDEEADKSNSSTYTAIKSTPMRTFQISAQFGMESNLMDQDSEMQNALHGMDSYEITRPSSQTRELASPLMGLSWRRAGEPVTPPQPTK